MSAANLNRHSNLKADYDPVTRVLTVQFGDDRFEYSDVPAETAAELRAAPSRGAYFNRAVRSKFTYRKL